MKRPPNRILLPLALGVAALVLWNTVVAYPFRVFIVFLHEISHGLAAVLWVLASVWVIAAVLRRLALAPR